jgi:hypothetical protein
LSTGQGELRVPADSASALHQLLVPEELISQIMAIAESVQDDVLNPPKKAR